MHHGRILFFTSWLDMNSVPRRPNFFIAGAQKSGTSTLYNMLVRHPDIFLSQQKELDFFSKPPATRGTFDQYLEHFASAGTEKYVGEATPHYFSSARGDMWMSPIARQISQMVGKDIRIALILRDPVERTLAGWRHNIIHGSIGADVSPFDAPPGQGIIHLSHYARHWQIWHEMFADACFHVSVFDDLTVRPRGLLEDHLEWLGLHLAQDVYDRFDFQWKFNSSDQNRKRRNIETLPRVDLSTVERLSDLFADDIELVRNQTGQPLAHWGRAEEICDRYNASVSLP